jgi:hypothetical protein
MFTACLPNSFETLRICAVYTVLEATMRYGTVVGLLALMGALWAQTPKSVIGFETPQHGWLVLPGAGGKVELTENPNDVKSGKRALRYTYTAAAGKLNAIVYLEPELWAQGFRFWVKADRPALFALSLQEQGGERWVAPFWVSGNEWQRVTIALADFTLAEDTKPVNNKLDMDEVEGLGLIDVSALFATTPEAAILFGDQTGDAHAVAGRFRVPIGRARAPCCAQHARRLPARLPGVDGDCLHEPHARGGRYARGVRYAVPLHLRRVARA